MHVLPFALAIAYLAINLPLVVWIAREETSGRAPAGWLIVVTRVVRWVPPLLGLLYLVTIAGDWPFFLFVLGFFTFAFFLLDRGVGFPSQPRKR